MYGSPHEKWKSDYRRNDYVDWIYANKRVKRRCRVGTRNQGITRAVYGLEACWKKTAGLAAFFKYGFYWTGFLVKFSEKIPEHFFDNLHDSFDYSGSYWLSRGMITFESYSEDGLVSYTGRVCGREIMLTSFAHQSKETRTFNLQKR